MIKILRRVQVASQDDENSEDDCSCQPCKHAVQEAAESPGPEVFFRGLIGSKETHPEQERLAQGNALADDEALAEGFYHSDEGEENGYAPGDEADFYPVLPKAESRRHPS